jgi:3-oxoacyl-[acyl-carrier protein] reductase
LRIVVTGASRGIGAAIAAHFSRRGDQVISLSRGPASTGDWVHCDLADPAAIQRVAGQIGDPVDALIHVAGIWEETAFSPDYEFASRPATETSRILSVNLQSPILLAQALLPAMTEGSRIVLIGSTSGLDQIGTPEVAYNASKAGLRGAAQALALARDGVGVTIINPGDVETDEVIAAKADGSMRAGAPITMADVVRATEFALTLSASVVFSEINLMNGRA